RRLEELLDLAEGDDLVELEGDLLAAHAQDGPVEVDVLAPGQLGVEAGADLQQGTDAAVDLGPAAGGFGDLRQDFEQRALAGPVAADDAHDLAAFHLERNVLEGVERLRRAALIALEQA